MRGGLDDPLARDPRYKGETRRHVRIKPRRSYRVNDRVTVSQGEEVLLPESIVAKSPHLFEPMDEPTEVRSEAPARRSRTRALEGGEPRTRTRTRTRKRTRSRED